MKRMLLVLACFGLGVAAKAQQDPQFTFYMYDQLSFNPASAGIKGNMCFTPIFRSQWLGQDLGKTPQTVLFNYEMPLSVLGGGVGVSYINDVLGAENNNILRLHYSYHFDNILPGKLGVGLSYGIINKSLGDAWVTPTDPVGMDPSIDGSKVVGTNATDIAFGAYYYETDLHLGISATHLAPGVIPDVNMKTQTHVYVTGGKNFNVRATDKVRTNFLVKTDLRAAAIDLTVDYLWNGMFWGGVNYRFSDGVAPMVGMQRQVGPGMLQAGVAYGITTSQLSSYNNGNFELMFKYCLTPKVPVSSFKYHNVRNL